MMEGEKNQNTTVRNARACDQYVSHKQEPLAQAARILHTRGVHCCSSCGRQTREGVDSLMGLAPSLKETWLTERTIWTLETGRK